VLQKELGDTFFDVGALRDGDVAGEVFDGVEEAVLFDDGDSDCVEVGIEICWRAAGFSPRPPMFSAMVVKWAPALAPRVMRSGSPGYWWR
jgi:hypothetical protein